MGRRRWRFVAIAAILLIYVKDTKCQDNYYIPQPVERNFAQVQPPLFNNRPSTVFDHADYREAAMYQQPLYNDGRVRFPSPNYNQNPSPFQLPTRSQNNPQYIANPPEFIPTQRQSIRPPFNYEFQHPASTIRPDTSQIHSVAYQNDPSKPEAFLGQVTLNNPDIDFLQQNRFKNIQFDGNSLKSNGQSGHISHDEIDNDDLYDQPKVTTYNPNKNKLRLNPREDSKYVLPPVETEIPEKYPIKYLRQRTKPKLENTFTNQNSEASTEYKELLGLLEDDVSDISKFTELMKNPKTSFDVEVINSNNSDESIIDSKPSASSMNTDNSKNSKTYYSPRNKLRNFAPTTTTTTSSTTTTTTTTTSTQKPLKEEHLHEEHDKYDEEYGEYYDDSEIPESTTIKEFHKSEEDADIYDYYDTEEQNHTEEVKTHNHATEITKIEVTQIATEEPKLNTTQYDIVIMKPNKTMVKDDNFHDFVDTSLIDQTTEQVINNESYEISTSSPVSYEEYSSVETPSILGQEVVSVVTTKSVVNGTIAVPDVTFSPSTVRINAKTTDSSIMDTSDNDTSMPMTTENWIVVASVQTSRSVSGARFLPFPGVEQEEKKQVLSDDKEEDLDSEQVTLDPNADIISSTMNNSSTENINDKLDSIQSELSSAVLSGTLSNDNKNIELITETTTENYVPNITTIATTQGPLNVFTLKMIQSSTESEKSAPDPLPVLIKKFTHRTSTTSTSTTPKPKKKLVTVMDDLAGFLPPGYKPRLSFKDKRTSTTSTTTSTTTTTTPIPSTVSTSSVIDGTQGRSSGINSKNRVIVLDDKSLIPKEYKPKEIKLKEDIFKSIEEESISKFLPPGYKPPVSDVIIEKTPSLIDKIAVQKVDITSFLPKGFKFNTSNEEPRAQPKTPSVKLPKPDSIDFASLLPPGYKLNSSESNSKEDSSIPLEKFKIADISNLLPPGFNLNSHEETDITNTKVKGISSTTKGPGSFKVVFPSRPGGKSTRKPILKASSSGPPLSTPKILKGWPTRASTEFTGWPTVSTTPFSFDKLLETIKSTSSSPREDIPEVVTRRSTTTTTTTTPKPAPATTPGICQHDCDIAATIKLVSGAKWVPELLDHHTMEWQNLAKELKQELNSVYSKSDLLKKWYKGVRIDSFSKGSVLVDYIIELNEVEEKVDTLTLKKMFHKSLHDAKPGSVVESPKIEEDDAIDFNPDMMQGDQPDEERMKKSNEKMTKTIDKSAGKLEIGKFVMDPAYTEFIVLPRREEPRIVQPEEEAVLPQWGIAVIVIALASLLFVVIFGVTVLVNRQKSAKAKQPIPLSEDMFRDLDKNHMGGFDDMNLNEREHPYSSGKSISTAAFIEQLAYSNPGDSWRSEWTPQMHKYMQHYTPDSGRGSQIYGHAGNQYGPTRQVSFRRSLRGESRKHKRNRHPFGYGGGGGSQLYGHLGGGGSQGYGYTGEYPRGQYPVRRRSDYDTNF